jgi:hypothetical protein
MGSPRSNCAFISSLVLLVLGYVLLVHCLELLIAQRDQQPCAAIHIEPQGPSLPLRVLREEINKGN